MNSKSIAVTFTRVPALPVLILRIAAAALNALLPLLCTLLFSPDLFGQFALIAIVIVGFDAAFQTYAATNGIKAATSKRLPNYIKDYNRVFASGVFVASSCGLATWFFLGQHLSSPILGFAVLTLWPISICVVRLTEIEHRSNNKPIIGYAISQIIPIVTTITLFFLIRILGIKPDLFFIILCFLGGFLVSAAASFQSIGMFFRNHRGQSLGFGAELPALLLCALPVVAELFPVMAIGLSHDYRNTGVFEIVRRFSWVCGFPGSALWASMSLAFANAAHEGRYIDLLILVKKSRLSIRPFGLVVIVTAVICLLLYFSVTRELNRSVSVMVISMMVPQLIFVFYWPSMLLPLLLGKHREFYFISVIAVGLGMAIAVVTLHQGVVFSMVSYWVVLNLTRAIGYALLQFRLIDDQVKGQQ